MRHPTYLTPAYVNPHRLALHAAALAAHHQFVAAGGQVQLCPKGRYSAAILPKADHALALPHGYAWYMGAAAVPVAMPSGLWVPQR
jgi:hypothetical protein